MYAPCAYDSPAEPESGTEAADGASDDGHAGRHDRLRGNRRGRRRRLGADRGARASQRDRRGSQDPAVVSPRRQVPGDRGRRDEGRHGLPRPSRHVVRARRRRHRRGLAPAGGEGVVVPASREGQGLPSERAGSREDVARRRRGRLSGGASDRRHLRAACVSLLIIGTALGLVACGGGSGGATPGAGATRTAPEASPTPRASATQSSRSAAPTRTSTATGASATPTPSRTLAAATATATA